MTNALNYDIIFTVKNWRDATMIKGIITILNGVPMVRVDTKIYKISDKKKVNPFRCRFVVFGYIEESEFVVESYEE